jgi:hypothetical protein
MASVLKVDQLQLSDGSTPTAGDLGIDTSGNVIQYASSVITTDISLSPGGAFVNLITIDFTPKYSTSTIVIRSTFNNLQKVTGAGINTWFKGKVQIDSVDVPNGSFGPIGYPETYNNHRFNLSTAISTSAWSGAKTVALQGAPQSTGSNWTVSYQNEPTILEIYEISA